METFVLTIFVIVALDTGAVRYAGRAPNTGTLGTLAYATVALILNLPAVVLTYRYVCVARVTWVDAHSLVQIYHDAV